MSLGYKKREANSEQSLAIRNMAGMTLSAGAGAGKTFVLVEHLICRLDKIYKDHFIGKWNDQSVKVLQEKLLRIVLITFTRKASGELEARIRERINTKISEREIDLNEIEESEEYWTYWDTVSENLNFVFVSTIHSFCQKLLNQKSTFVPIDNFVIVDEIQYRHKIRKLFEDFLTENQATIKPSLLLFSAEVEKALQKIFSNVETRIRWTDAPKSIDESKMFNTMFSDMQILLDMGEVWDFVPVELVDTKKPKKWMEALGEYNKLCVKYEGLEAWTVEALNECYETFKSLRKANFDDGTESQKKVMNQIYKLKDERVKAFLDSISAYLENKEFILEFYHFVRNSFNFLEKNFYLNGDIAFNDLEYLVVRYLNNSEAKKVLNTQFDVVVVDEFQDTSNVQFEILNIVTGGDFSKVIAVGDLKQAIYGFRGGEVGVFQKAKEIIGHNLSLKNNYRSLRNIINFNNGLFEFVFPLGQKFIRNDRFAFDYEKQLYPANTLDFDGKINILKTILECAEKPSAFDVKKIEANAIAQKIAILIASKPSMSIAVLYRKLSGSELLIEELQKRGIKFSAQTKILFKNEPAYLLTRFLLDLLMVDRNKDRHVQAVRLRAVETLRLFDINLKESQLVQFLDQFEKTYRVWGIRFALESAFFKLGISDSRHTEVWSKIISLIEISEDSLSLLDLSLKKISDEMTSTVLESNGSGPGVQIMTVHASKGLEFDHVFVAGIHNNGKTPVDKSKIGEDFLSFSWKIKKSDKKELKTPWMLLEQTRQKELDFSESKRLFYVACTRAKSELYFTNIFYKDEGVETAFYVDENSWITALRKYFEFTTPEGLVVAEEICSVVRKQSELGEEEEAYEGTDEDLSLAPTFHKSHLGIKVNPRVESLGVIGEMSVTKLAEISECPRKFYFNSVLKLKSEELTIAPSFDEELSFVPTSTKERGTELHEKIYLYLKSTEINKKIDPDLNWVIDQLKKLENANTFIEKEMKFSFFGQMISGTPDWFSMDFQNKNINVVDYKTGKLTDEKILKYNTQVLIYSYGILKNYSLPVETMFNLILLSIDEQKMTCTTLSGSEVIAKSFQLWQKIYQLDQVRLDHCTSCHFQSYCQEK